MKRQLLGLLRPGTMWRPSVHPQRTISLRCGWDKKRSEMRKYYCGHRGDAKESRNKYKIIWRGRMFARILRERQRGLKAQAAGGSQKIWEKINLRTRGLSPPPQVKYKWQTNACDNSWNLFLPRALPNPGLRERLPTTGDFVQNTKSLYFSFLLSHHFLMAILLNKILFGLHKPPQIKISSAIYYALHADYIS